MSEYVGLTASLLTVAVKEGVFGQLVFLSLFQRRC
jgi:hypothetical protein